MGLMSAMSQWGRAHISWIMPAFTAYIGKMLASSRSLTPYYMHGGV